MGCFGYVVRAHLLLTDMALLAGFAMAYYGLAAALKRRLLGGFWLGTGVGIGFLANGLLAPIVLGATALLLPALGRDWRSRNYAVALGTAAAAAPWLRHLAPLFYLRAPDLFEAWLRMERLGRYFGQAPGAASDLYS